MKMSRVLNVAKSLYMKMSRVLNVAKGLYMKMSRVLNVAKTFSFATFATFITNKVVFNYC